MPDRVFIPRLFLLTGTVLAVFGMILWLTLPISGMFPPYLVTALLALAYGGVWHFRGEAAAMVKTEPSRLTPKPEVPKDEAVKPQAPKS